MPKGNVPPTRRGRERFSFIDLFCGIGGFRIGFERAGCECVWSCDSDKHVQKTYEANFGERPHGDIHSIGVAGIPSHDILCASFPCQPFSDLLLFHPATYHQFCGVVTRLRAKFDFEEGRKS